MLPGSRQTRDRTGQRRTVAGGLGIAPDQFVIAGVGSLIALVVIAVVISIILIANVGGGVAALAGREVRYAVAIDGAALYAKALANDERGFLISGNDEFLVQIERRTDEARAQFSEALSAANDLQRAATARARDEFERWLVAMRDHLELFRAGNHDAAIAASLGETRSLRKLYEASLEEAQLLARETIRTATSAASQTSTQSMTILIAYLVLSTTFGVVVSIWLVRTIMRPAYTLLRLVAPIDDRSTAT